MHSATEHFLREHLSNSIVLVAREDGQISAIIFEGVARQNTLTAPAEEETLALTEGWLQSYLAPPEATIPNNELPEPAPETLRPSEVANV